MPLRDIFRRLRQGAETAALELDRLENSFDWPGWAAQHGWTYHGDAPELIGRWVPPYAGTEQIRNHMTARLNGLDVEAFERVGRQGHTASSGGGHTLGAFLIVHLPGPPAPELAAMGPRKAFRAFGGTIPTGIEDLAFVETALVTIARGHLDPAVLADRANVLTLQLAAAPPEAFVRR